MNFYRSKRAKAHYEIGDDRPAKRISTPAGQRLSVILDAKRGKSASSKAAEISVTTESTFCNDPSHQHVGPVQHHRVEKKPGFIQSVLTGGRLLTPRESSEDMHNGSNLSVSVWSDRDEEKFGHVRQRRQRGCAAWGWKKLAVVAALIIALIVALGVGLAMGLKKDSKSSTPAANTGGSTTPAGTDSKPASNPDSNSPSTTDDDPPSAVATSTPSAVPSNFPVGSWSFVLFLDTVTTDCTSDADTWTCPPNTNYYDDQQKALTILNWDISGSAGSWKISSGKQDDTFDTTFQNEDLELLDAGKDTERYRFQITRSKTVNMTGSLGGKRGDFECDYGATNMQGILYTKMQQTYPDDTIAVGKVANKAWPYAVKIEQSVAGGQGVPACTSSSGDDVRLKPQIESTLCSCFYKNFTPPPKS
ncbi:uncharacterized protein J4E84_010830 [Alternaria hordeiaustralica]|uniref:uncharacterized protein n=1 Tax=Alternaria hordeiaustralica TaxID=1187925 RepID=UPI0020C2E74D|nr:uncharacterized protein J4E84_010830 [Alternaria hordeiaustralica]KAI4674130.1 hypothetical protein J4E84_010830 [Alternaria hordeiaustralica]